LTEDGDELVMLVLMKKFLLSALLFATWWCFTGAAQERPPTHDEGAAPERGRVTGQTYNNDQLGVTYQLPDDFLVAPDIEDTLPGGSFLLLIADQHTGRPWKNRLLLVADDARKYRSDLTTSEYVAKYIRAKKRDLHAEILRDGYRLEIAGKEFYRADYRKVDGGVPMYETFACTRLKGYLLSWTFASTSQEELAQMASSIQTVSFREIGRK
jgi:hypothetical protein